MLATTLRNNPMARSLNQKAMEIIGPILNDPQRYGAKLVRTPGGATIVDIGNQAPGSWQGAKRFVEASFGGLAEVTFGRMVIKDLDVPSVEVAVDDPMLAVVACQVGAMRLGEGAFAALGSGPARAKARADRWAQRVLYEDPSPLALIQIQMPGLPSEEILQEVADACRIPLANLTAMVAPTASLVGSVQVASRAFEQCIVALARNTSFDITSILRAQAVAPIAPVIDDELWAMGRTNDCLVYGGSSSLWVRHSNDDEIRRTAESLPFSVSAGDYYGKGYREIFDAYGRSIYNIPAHLDGPAMVAMTNQSTGSVFKAGEINLDRLYRSFTETPGRRMSAHEGCPNGQILGTAEGEAACSQPGS
jgi:methenyltetrahydromethanopterin cyclohydrolase